MRFYIQTKPEQIRQDKNSPLFFLVSQTHRRRFAKSKTAAGRAPTKSRQNARQKAGTQKKEADRVRHFCQPFNKNLKPIFQIFTF